MSVGHSAFTLAFRTQLFYDGAIQRLYSVCVAVNEYRDERGDAGEWKRWMELYIRSSWDLDNGLESAIRVDRLHKAVLRFSAASFFLANVRARMDKGNAGKNVWRSTNEITST